jgi:hypothetical protein
VTVEISGSHGGEYENYCLVSYCVVWQKFVDVSEVFTAIIRIALMMKAVSTSETSVNSYETAQGNIPEDSHLRCESS